MDENSPNALSEAKTIHVPHSGDLATTLTHVDYQLDGAIAELIDNSLDAESSNILIRIIRSGGYPKQLLVIDNGNGITKQNFNSAMTWAERRQYGDQDTGMFGVGMKSSSLALCNTLTVVSKAIGNEANGRRWTREGASEEKLIEIRQQDCKKLITDISKTVPWGSFSKGTVVIWDEVDEFAIALAAGDEPGPLLKRIILGLEHSLGLIFHRFIDRKTVALQIDIQDSETGDVFGLHDVESINPFGYTKTGRPGYPKVFKLKSDEMAGMKMKAHIWPKGMRTINFKIPRSTGTAAADSQGLYVYRSDRLLMTGRWAGVETFEAHKLLARMEIDLPNETPKGVKVNFHKTAVTFQPSIVKLIRSSRSTDGKGTTFEQWIKDALEADRTPDEDKKVPIELPIPSNGLPVEVRRSFKDNSTSGKPLAIEWGRVGQGKAFRLSEQKIVINQDFKAAFNSGESGGNRSSSLSLSLLVLALRDIVGKKKTSKHKAIEEAIQKIVFTAMKENS